MDLFMLENKSQEGTQDITDYEIKQGKKSKILFDIKTDCAFKHGDKTTNLITARMLNKNERHSTIAPDTAKYVCFEIPTTMSVNELAEKDIFDILGQIGKFDKLQNNCYTHIGIIDKIGDKYELYNPTHEVLTYTKSVLNQGIGQNNKMLSNMMQHRQEFIRDIAKPAEDYMAEAKARMEKRKKDPYLEEQYKYMINGRVCTDYEGVNIENGKIMNIKRLGKVEETENGTLYSTYIQSKDSEDRIELKTLQDIPEGYPIMFTSELPIEEMIKDKEQIKNLLQLLSTIPLEKLTENMMQYVGRVDKEGNIDRQEKNCERIILKRIKEEQARYKKEKNQEYDNMIR